MLKQALCEVVIIDDELLIRQGIKHYINWEQAGFQIVGEASNGNEALQLIEKSRPHIVITDIVMPIMDGEALTGVIREKYPEIQVIVLSSFSNFDYVRSTFQNGVSDYILKPKLEGEALLKTLKKAANNIPNFHFSSEVEGNTNAITFILDRMMWGNEVDYDERIVNTAFPENTFCLLDIAIVQKGRTSYTQVKKDIDETLGLYFDETIFHPVIFNEKEAVFLLNFKKTEMLRIKHVVEQVTRCLSDKIPGIFLTLNKPYDSIRETKQNYQDKLLQLRSYRFYFPDKSVLFFDDFSSITEKETFNLNRFIEVFKHEDFDDAFDYLKGHVSYLSSHITKTEDEYKSFLGNIIFNITVLLGNLNYDNEKLDKKKYDYFTSINDSVHVKEAEACLYNFLDEINEIIMLKANDNKRSNFEKLIDYIDQHYSEPLKLKEVANHFHFNPSYLSSYFSTHYQEGYNEYLNRVRIEKAKEYLRENKISISEISGMTGYADHSYFCKVFKKRTGMSPSSYRRNLMGRK
ncbi:two-component system response regulator YesN [Virgibacillus halotolerans]|uniref:response regulator transcription factor n=1 Tax=Virgibacillus halotolerans TaxID=1071053 RepID=UPI00196206F0|nr:response regulator transcription factor [Virgibacillus halotolerans]MBM7600051.1 two-component system response regulator YesN [Virgibacillus halotolerans]